MSNNLIASILVAIIVISIIGAFSATTAITGLVSGTTTVTVATSTTISMPVSTVAFGSKSPGDSDNTTDNVPPPFQIQNDGNVLINVTISATDLWTTAPNPSSYYQFACGTGEVACPAGSITTFTNMTSTPTKFIVYMNYTAAADLLKVDIAITVPPEEPAGSRSSTVTLTASAA